jgi:8-oxo-dGTP diphosphatase
VHHSRLGEYAIEVEQAGPAVLRDAEITSNAGTHVISLESGRAAEERGWPAGWSARPGHPPRSVAGVTAADPPADAGPPLPAIPASAGALIFDQAGRLLILNPVYKSGWTIPGGVMEADGETPWDACRREVREECGLEVRQGRLACVDFRRPRPGKPGGIRFLFDCGVLPGRGLAGIVLQAEEISEYRLVPLPEALDLLRKPIRRRVRAACRGTVTHYLENGRPVPAVGP